MAEASKAAGFSSRNWTIVIIIGLFGQIAWTIENMYFNVFVYNTIADNPDVIAAMVAASAVVATLTTLLMGAVSDHVRRRKVFISAGYVLWGLSTMAFAVLTPETLRALLPGVNTVRAAIIGVIALDCVMTFFGSTANDAAFNAWVTDVTVPGNRGRVQSVLAALPLLAMLIVFGALDPLTQSGRWNAFFIVTGVATISAGLLNIVLMREPANKIVDDTPLWQKIRHGFEPSVVAANKKLYVSFLALLILSIATQIYMPFLLIYLQHYLKIEAYALVLGIVLIGASAASLIGGRLIDRRGKIAVFKTALNIQLFGLIAMYYVRDTLGVSVAGFVMMSGFMLLLTIVNGLIQDHLPAGMAGRFQGIRMLFAVLLPMLIGPFIGAAVIKNARETYVELGVVKNVPTPWIFMAAAIALCFIAIPYYFLRPRGAGEATLPDTPDQEER